MKRLIVNADDLGRTRGINQGIREAHQRGIVTSATVMVNYPAAREVRVLAQECPGLGLGLHFALTGGVPTLPPASVPSLVDAAGRLPAKPEGLARATKEDAIAEARAQLGRFRELIGRPPTHLDSHHHSHRLPAVFEAIATVAKENGLPVRCASPEMVARLRGRGVRTSDVFVESFFDETATLPKLLGILESLGDGTTELMCHPAYADPELVASSSYAKVRERELAVLTSPEPRAAIERLGIRLIQFGQL
jgi:predicted glycoside hydrolase/deacetylase ChbG (UPF0249 family)